MTVQEELAELKSILSSPSLKRYTAVEYAQEARNEKRANWLDSFAERLHGKINTVDSPNLINQKTGKIHTVESMVEELRERVKLDTLKKSAETKAIPLTAFQVYASAKKKENELKQSVEKFISSFISSHRGYVSLPGILFALREKFDNTDLLKIDSWIKKVIADTISQVEESRPQYSENSSGVPVKLDLGEDAIQPLFPNIRNI
jgi:hypothetical protein